MDRRPLRALAFFGKLTLAAFLGVASVTALHAWESRVQNGAEYTAAALRPGTPVPALFAAREQAGAATLLWIVQDASLVRCNTAAYDIRRLQHEFAGRVQLKVVRVGPATPWLAAFLSRERLVADVADVSDAEYRRMFGSARVPALYLVRDGKIRSVDLQFTNRSTRRVAGGTTVNQAVRTALAAEPRAVARSSSAGS